MSRSNIISLNLSPGHTMSKKPVDKVEIIKGIGIMGDAHSGKKVKHRSRVRQNPDQPNLRQVHLIHSELFDELKEKGFQIKAGEMGENITTRGIDLLALSEGTRLRLGEKALIEITGLRNPCDQLDGLYKGLLKAVLDKDEDGKLIRKAGIMAVVLTSGEVFLNDKITIEYQPKVFKALERV